MSYAVSGLVHEYRAPHYPQHEPFVPHGMSVVLNAPSVYRFTASACPDRHLDAAQRLGADLRGATLADAGEVLAGQIIKFMQATRFPGGLSTIGANCSAARSRIGSGLERPDVRAELPYVRRRRRR